jgi:hypothetical protein
MALDRQLLLERALEGGDEWQSWRARRLLGTGGGQMPFVPGQDEVGAFEGPTGRASPGATGVALCHFVILGMRESGAATIAADWLEAARTPAMAWLDSPDEVPGGVDTPAAGRVWATASATCGLLACGRDPGARAIDLLRGEADLEGRFTGGAYPTFAAAGAYWLSQGPKTEMAEWGLRWARQTQEEWWGPWERATALTFWGAARVPLEHATVELFLDTLRDEAPAQGWVDDLDLSLHALELMEHFEYA